MAILHPDIPHTRRCRHVLHVALGNRRVRFKAFLSIMHVFPNGKTVKEQMLNKKSKTKHVRNEYMKCMGENCVCVDKDLGPTLMTSCPHTHINARE